MSLKKAKRKRSTVIPPTCAEDKAVDDRWVPKHVMRTEADIDLFRSLAAEAKLKRLEGVDEARGDPIADWLLDFRDSTADAIERARLKGGFARPLPRVVVDLVNSGNLNAFATEYKDRPVIGLYAGSILCINSAVFRMLCDPDILREVGDATSEVKTQWRAPISSNFSEIRQAIVYTGEHLAPIAVDPVRNQYAYALSALSCNFLAAHELWHIVEGHAGYLLEHGRERVMLEVAGASREPLTPLENQAIEVSADRGGVSHILDKCFSIIKEPDEWHLSLQAAMSTPSDAVFIALLAAGVVLKLMDLARGVERGSWASMWYPPPPLRWLFVVVSTEHWLREKGIPIDSSKLQDIARRVLEVVEFELGGLAGCEVDNQLLDMVYGEIGAAHVSLVGSTYLQLLPRLRQHAYATLL